MHLLMRLLPLAQEVLFVAAEALLRLEEEK